MKQAQEEDRHAIGVDARLRFRWPYGSAALQESRNHSVTLEDRKDFLEVTPARLHLLVAPESLGDCPRFRYLDLLGMLFVLGLRKAGKPTERCSIMAGKRISIS